MQYTVQRARNSKLTPNVFKNAENKKNKKIFGVLHFDLIKKIKCHAGVSNPQPLNFYESYAKKNK